MKIDIHNHGVPETVLDFFASRPEFGIEITADHHMTGGAEGPVAFHYPAPDYLAQLLTDP